MRTIARTEEHDFGHLAHPYVYQPDGSDCSSLVCFVAKQHKLLPTMEKAKKLIIFAEHSNYNYFRDRQWNAGQWTT